MFVAKLKNDVSVQIRNAEESDAAAVVEFYNQVGGETDFLSFGGNEYALDTKKQVDEILRVNGDDASVMLLALKDDNIIGIATISSGSKRRMRHVGVLGIVIELSCCGLGLGRVMIAELIKWSKENGITRKINLVTREDNKNAIKLYEDFGFKTEGVLIMDNFEKGKYYNSLAMGLVLQ